MTETFKEGFEIVICTHDDEEIYDYQKGEYRPEYLEEIANTLSELGISKDQIEHDETDVGVGASAEAIFLIITGLTALFLAGKKIDENIDAWIKLGKRFKGVLKKLKKRENGEKNLLYISEPFAMALALGDIVESKPEAIIVLETSRIEEIPNPSIGSHRHGIFKYDQMRYYIFTFRVFDSWETLHLICIRSTGDIEFHHILHVGNWMDFSLADINTDDA